MLDIMIGVPPIIHVTMSTSNDVIALILGLIIAFVLAAAAIIWVAIKQRKQSQMIKAQYPHEMLEPIGSEQPQRHVPEESKLPIWR